MPAVQPLYTARVASLEEFLSNIAQPLRLHSTVTPEAWRWSEASSLYEKLWSSRQMPFVVFRDDRDEEGRVRRGELVASALDGDSVRRSYFRSQDSSHGVVIGASLCRVLLMTANVCYARDPDREILRSERVSFDALQGTFSSASKEPMPSLSAPPTVIPDIIALRPARCGHDLERVVRDHVVQIVAAVAATGTALDESSVSTIQQNITDLRDLLWLRDVHVVYMRTGATDADLNTALLELGVIRPPEPAPVAPPRATRRRRTAGTHAVDRDG